MTEDRFHELLVDLHKGLSRLGPGNPESTSRALALCEHLPALPHILNVGCGAGAETLTLAAASHGHITATDLSPTFLSQVETRIGEMGLESRVTTRVADMHALPFVAETFDLIWSEGAIYIMGFDAGLAKWRTLLRPGGYMVVSELSWFLPNPPREPQSFWADNYPAMRSVDENLAAARSLGWTPVEHFHLPVEAWTDEYYGPLAERLRDFRAAHVGDAAAEKVAEMTECEIGLFKSYSDYYGYEFYILRREEPRSADR